MSVANIGKITAQERQAIEVFRTVKNKADQERVILRLSGYIDALVQIEQEHEQKCGSSDKIINFPNGKI